MHPSNNKTNVKIWESRINSTLKKVFPEMSYIEAMQLDCVGLFVILFVKEELFLGKILFSDTTEDKIGKFSLGNKAFLTFSFKYMNKIFSIAACHLASGLEKNNKRIQTLKEILNKNIETDSDTIKRFKDADYWIILGDLNFRIDLSSANELALIQDKNYKDLYGIDQFNLAYEDDNNAFLKENIKEGIINFRPTYKLEKNSDNYEYKEGKIREPAWCDRILYSKRNRIRVVNYNGIFSLRLSDHRPVICTFEVLL